MSAAENSYSPVRRGHIYCAPLCGFNCTWKAYRLAAKRANDVYMQLGILWRPRIWENCGWHSEAVFDEGYLRVVINTKGSAISGSSRITNYTAYLSETDTDGSAHWSGSGKTPKDAVKEVAKEFQHSLQQYKTINEILRQVRT